MFSSLRCYTIEIDSQYAYRFPLSNMITDQSTIPNRETVELEPSYNIPVILMLGAIILSVFQVWLCFGVGLFAIFLAIQAYTLRLNFTADSLKIYRGKKLIRDFPYEQWEYSEIFWSKLPILFYFREVNSIHFLPIIFDRKTLSCCLAKNPCNFKN